MDSFINSNIEKQTIYEIYRACRLCGAGAGYKMPIIQNVVDLDGRDVELRQKIRDCVQIEVHQDDKMPPLICELCVDKVNDFYEFFEMCRQTNKQTRLRLGLPPQKYAKGGSDSGDCILGVTEPVYINDDSNEPISGHRTRMQKSKIKKEPVAKVKIETQESRRESRSSRSSSAAESRRSTRGSASSPPASSRLTRASRELASLNTRQVTRSSAPLKSILKKEKDSSKDDANSSLSRSKRTRDKDNVKQEVQTKKVKIAVKPTPAPKAAPKPDRKQTPKQSPKQSAKPARGAAGRVAKLEAKPASSELTQRCALCGAQLRGKQALALHMTKCHSSTLTESKQLRSNRSGPASKRRSPQDSSSVESYVCGECGRTYGWLRSLERHKSMCRKKKKKADTIAVDPQLLGRLRPVQVRVARCDPLLARHCCSVAAVPQEFGLDSNCVYPYISSVRSLRIKTEPGGLRDGMVAIGDDIKAQFDVDENFVHWDSDISSDFEESGFDLLDHPKKKTVGSLSTLTLKTIFSPKLLGKVPRKRRKVKVEIPCENTESNRDDNNSVDSFDACFDVARGNKTEPSTDNAADFDALLRGDRENHDEVIVNKLNSRERETTNGKNNNEDSHVETVNTTTTNLIETNTKDCATDIDVSSNGREESLKSDEKLESNKNSGMLSDENSALNEDSLSNNSSNLEVNSEENHKIENASKNSLKILEVQESKEDNEVAQSREELRNVVSEHESEEGKALESKEEEISEKREEINENLLCKADSNIVSGSSVTKGDMVFDYKEEEVNKVSKSGINLNMNVRERTDKSTDEDIEKSESIHSTNNESELNNINSKAKVNDKLSNEDEMRIEEINRNLDNLVDGKMDRTENTSLENEQNEITEIEKDLDVMQQREDAENTQRKISLGENKTEQDPKIYDISQNGDIHDDKLEGNETKNDITVQESHTASDKGKCNYLNSVSVNGQTGEKPSYKLNMDELDGVSDTEMDDMKLMEALDAQIGESEASKEEKISDKITLEDLLPGKESDIKPMDLDAIGDGFSFEA